MRLVDEGTLDIVRDPCGSEMSVYLALLYLQWLHDSLAETAGTTGSPFFEMEHRKWFAHDLAPRRCSLQRQMTELLGSS